MSFYQFSLACRSVCPGILYLPNLLRQMMFGVAFFLAKLVWIFVYIVLTGKHTCIGRSVFRCLQMLKTVTYGTQGLAEIENGKQALFAFGNSFWFFKMQKTEHLFIFFQGIFRINLFEISNQLDITFPKLLRAKPLVHIWTANRVA